MLVNGIIGKKLGMTQVFQTDGTVVPVTVIQAGPCVVVSLRSKDRDGYEAAQLALVEPKRARTVKRPMKGHFEKAKLPPSRTVREFGLLGDVKVGDSIGATEFAEGDLVDVAGYTKGLGFQGVMRRHGFAGGAGSHGSMFHRAPGSIGASAFPSRTFKGMRAAGRAGGEHVTTKNLKVIRVEAERNLILVRGAVPGKPGSTVKILRAKAGKRKPMVSIAQEKAAGAKPGSKAGKSGR